MECSYCVLQGYLNNPLLVVHANVDDMFRELKQSFKREPTRLFRVGTGEFTDSLALDHLIDFTKLAVPFFTRKNNAFLELKTKTANVENLVGLHHGGKTIVAWSLNPERVILREEYKTASLSERLDAARICQNAGYLLAFHFDPIIHYKGWENDYHDVVERLFSSVDAERIVWISLGCLRFPQGLKRVIEQRFPGSNITYQEFIQGEDKKLRYFRPLRIKLYSQIVRYIRKYAPQVRLYFCMESQQVWQRVLGLRPRGNEHVNTLLGQSCLERCAIARSGAKQ
jgi:spore photoproduct lyase